MATVINNPGQADSSSNASLAVAVLVLLLIIAMLAYFGLPYIRGTGSATPLPEANMGQNEEPETNVQNNTLQVVPASSPSPTAVSSPAPSASPSSSETNIMVPDRIDVNVNRDDTTNE